MEEARTTAACLLTAVLAMLGIALVLEQYGVHKHIAWAFGCQAFVILSAVLLIGAHLSRRLGAFLGTLREVLARADAVHKALDASFPPSEPENG